MAATVEGDQLVFRHRDPLLPGVRLQHEVRLPGELVDVDRLLVETVRSSFPPHEHEQFVAHYRGELAARVTDAAALRQ